MKSLCLLASWALFLFTNNALNGTSGPITTQLITSTSEITTTSSSSVKCVYVINKNDISQIDEMCFNLSSVQVNISVASSIVENSSSNIETRQNLDYLWLLLTAFLVFAMQIGFTMLEAGNSNFEPGNLLSKSINVIFKSLMNISFASIGWYLFGYDVAFGKVESNGFIGNGPQYLALAHNVNWNSYFFEFMYCITSVAVVGGAVMERFSNVAYIFYSLLLSTWVYPIIAHWIWSDEGWLSSSNPNAALNGGIIDFAGSGVVFMVGGWTAFCAACILRNPNVNQKNEDYQENDNNNNIKEAQKNSNHIRDTAMQVLGILLIWFGWYGFNPGRTLAANDKMEIACKVAVTTTIAAASGGIMSAIISKNHGNESCLKQTINGILAGLVSISASCATVDIGHSIAIAVIGVIIYYGACGLLPRIKVDDPLKAFPIYGCCGMWGLIAAAWFSSSGNIAKAGFSEFLSNATRGRIFAGQILAVFVIVLWACFFSIALFIVLDNMNLLRSTKENVQVQQQQPQPYHESANTMSMDDDDDNKHKTQTQVGSENDEHHPLHDNQE